MDNVVNAVTVADDPARQKIAANQQNSWSSYLYLIINHRRDLFYFPLLLDDLQLFDDLRRNHYPPNAAQSTSME